MNLGVVPDVDGKRRMKIKEFYVGRVRMLLGKGPQFPSKAPGLGRVRHLRLDDHRRTLASGFTQPDQRAAAHAGVQPKNLFAWFRVQGAMRRLDAFGLPAAKPNSSVDINIAAVTHPVPDRRRVRGARNGK